jgi:kynureninase
MTVDADAQDASPVTLAAARAEFDADVTYLDTATFGLPPRRSWAALQQALAQWRAGTAGRLRLSSHVSTSDQDADLAAVVLRRHVSSHHPAAL